MTNISPDERISLKGYLSEHFDEDELKSLAFNLNISDESIPHNTRDEFARELILYCERTSKPNLGCLVAEVIKERANDTIGISAISNIANHLPCDPTKKVQIVITGVPQCDPAVLAELRKLLAARTNTPDGEINIMGCAPGSIRLLISLPAIAADRLAADPPPSLGDGKYPVESVTLFDQLDPQARQAWRARVWGAQNSTLPLWRRVLASIRAIRPPILVIILAAVLATGGWAVAPSVSVSNRCSAPTDPFLLFGRIPIGSIKPGDSTTIPLLPGSYQVKSQAAGANTFTISFTSPLGSDTSLVAPSSNVTIDGHPLTPTAPIIITAALGSSHQVVLCAR